MKIWWRSHPYRLATSIVKWVPQSSHKASGVVSRAQNKNLTATKKVKKVKASSKDCEKILIATKARTTTLEEKYEYPAT